MSSIGMRRTTLATVGLAVVGTMVLTGCKNGNEDPAPAQPTASATGSPSAPASPSAAGSEAPAGAPGMAKSGQTFKIGESAQIPFEYTKDTKGEIALTVIAIEQGNPADLDPLKLGDKVNGKVPYYIRYTIKNIGTTDLSYSSVGHIKGLLGDGTEAQGLSIIGKFEKCPHESLPKGFINGQTQTGCAVALAPSAQTKVAAAEYWGNPYNISTNSKGLVWK
ncbi:hypothetical protein [Streptomyces sp. NPDC059874]|uniref:hypothetical protein n=1 Tax=Streptomyces sp. NPDC059874 TaxID=3346983 RepID=UPI003650ADAF